MISIVICSIDPLKFQAVVSNYESLMSSEAYEIIHINDASSLCEGYNRGAALTKGSLIIFCHDDIEILNPDFATRIKHHLKEVDIVGVAGTRKLVHGGWIAAGPPHIAGQVVYLKPDGSYQIDIFGRDPAGYIDGIQALDGLFFAVRREVLDQLCFDEKTFDGFHLYDLDFTFSAYLANFRLRVANDIHILHGSGGRTDAAWQHYVQRFVVKHAKHLYPSYPAETVHTVVRATSKAQILRILGEATPTYSAPVPSELNFLVCFNWQHSLAKICETLSTVAFDLANQNIQQDLYLYVEAPDDLESINEAFQVLFFQLFEVGIDLTVKPCICLFPGQSPGEWQALLPHLAGRIATEYDSQLLLPAVSMLPVYTLPLFQSEAVNDAFMVLEH